MRTVQQLYDDKRDKVIIDMRDKEEYDKETMESAVWYFWEDMMKDLKADNTGGREKFINTYSKDVPIYLYVIQVRRVKNLRTHLRIWDMKHTALMVVSWRILSGSLLSI